MLGFQPFQEFHVLIVSKSTKKDLLTFCNAISLKFERADEVSYIWLKSLVQIFIFHAHGGFILVPFLAIDIPICAQSIKILKN
jgi:hypothetical protein